MKARERIVTAATKTFGRLGYAHTRVEDVLQDARVSRPTFYKEFSSVDDLFLTLARLHYGILAQKIVEEMQQAPKPRHKLDALIGSYFAWRLSLGSFGRVLDSESRSPKSALGVLRKPIIDGLINAFRSQIVALGRPAPDPLLLVALIAACEQLGDTLPQRDSNGEEVARRQAVMMRLAGAALAIDGEPMPPMPTERPPPARKRSNSSKK